MKILSVRNPAATIVVAALFLVSCGGGGGATSSSSGGSVPAPAPTPTPPAPTPTPPGNGAPLTLTMVGNGTVTSLPSSVNCTSSCTVNVSAGQYLMLTPVAAPGYTFTGWGEACPNANTNTLDCAVTMSQARSVTATFTQLTGPIYYFSDCQDGAHPQCVPGVNTNAGTSPSAPKQNLSGFNVDTLPAGTQLLFARGGAWNLSLAIENRNVTPTQPLVFDAYGTGAAPLWLTTSSGSTTVNFGDWGNTFNDGGYTFRNLRLDGGGTGQWGFWLHDYVRNVTIENVEMTGFVIGIHSQSVNYFTVRNCNIHDNRNHGMLGGGDNMVLENNLVEQNNTDGGAMEHGFYLSHGTDVVIRNNQFINNSTPANGICDGGNFTLHGQLTNWLVEDNLIQQDQSAPGCWGISITSGYNTPEYFRNFTVRNNTVINVGNTAIAVHAAPGIIIENNRIRNTQATSQTAVALTQRTDNVGLGDDTTTNAVIRNNIICYSQPGTTVTITSPSTGTETGTTYRTGADASTGFCAF